MEMNRLLWSLILLMQLCIFGCEPRHQSRLDTLRVTRIQWATIRGPGIPKEIEISNTQNLIMTLYPHAEISSWVVGLEQFDLTISAAGETAHIHCWPNTKTLTFELDGRYYSGGDANAFRSQIQRLKSAP